MPLYLYTKRLKLMPYSSTRCRAANTNVQKASINSIQVAHQHISTLGLESNEILSSKYISTDHRLEEREN